MGLQTEDLTTHQIHFVNTWLSNGENRVQTAREMGWGNHGQCTSYLKNTKIQVEIARRKGVLHAWLSTQHALGGVTREMKAQLLWEVAKAGAERGFDKEGNPIMINPASTISAVRELNSMAGHHAPTVVEQKVEVVHRSELEIKANIQSLQAEVTELLSIEGEVIEEGG